MKPLTENQELWLQDLESGKFEQGTEQLCKDGAYCCLGVACVRFATKTEEEFGAIAFDGSALFAPDSVVKALGLKSIAGDIIDSPWKMKSLSSANDLGKTFLEIAAFIRANPEKVFV